MRAIGAVAVVPQPGSMAFRQVNNRTCGCGARRSIRCCPRRLPGVRLRGGRGPVRRSRHPCGAADEGDLRQQRCRPRFRRWPKTLPEERGGVTEHLYIRQNKRLGHAADSSASNRRPKLASTNARSRSRGTGGGETPRELLAVRPAARSAARGEDDQLRFVDLGRLTQFVPSAE